MSSMRSAVIEFNKSGKSTSEIFHLFKNQKVNRNFVCRSVQRYNETGTSADRPRSGRLLSERTPKMKRILQSRITRHSKRSTRQLVKELDVSEGTIRNAVNKDLHIKAYKLQKAHFLTTDT